MKKRCTVSACRRTFNAKVHNGVCPYCGKFYRMYGSRFWDIKGRRLNVSPLFAPELRGKKIPLNKRLRAIYESVYGPDRLSLRTAKEIVDAMCLKWPELTKPAE